MAADEQATPVLQGVSEGTTLPPVSAMVGLLVQQQWRKGRVSRPGLLMQTVLSAKDVAALNIITPPPQ